MASAQDKPLASWKQGVFCDIAIIEMGQSPPGHSYNNQGRGVPLINGPTEFTERFPIARQWTTEPTKLCQGEDILLCVRGSSTGRINISNDIYCIGRGVAAIRAESGEGSTQFIEYLLHHCSQRILARTAGSTFPNIDKRSLSLIPVLIPPFPEQRRIAEILGTWDKDIALVEQRIEAARQRKKGLMQRLLTGRVRFREFEGEEWREAQLGEFFQEFTKRNRDNEDLTVLSCSTIHGIVPQTQVFSRRIASENTERYKVVEHGDLVYDPMLLWDASIGFLEAVERGVVSPAYSTFKFRKENGVREYFKYLIKMHYLTEHYKFISQGTNVRRRKAPIEAFLKLKVKVPSTMAEQRRIAAVLQTCDREIELLQQKRDALQRQKKGLMQHLLTGRVRVSLPPPLTPPTGGRTKSHTSVA